jgi:hypothetical protein
LNGSLNVNHSHDEIDQTAMGRRMKANEKKHLLLRCGVSESTDSCEIEEI